jgi:hypothetical protein
MINIRQKQNNDTEIILDDIQIAQLEALSNYLSIEQVAGYFKISVDDLLSLQKKDKRVLRAFETGKIRGVVKVAQLLWQQMEAGNVSAMIFFLGTRGGWSEQPFKEDTDELPKSKPIKIRFKNIEVQKVQIDIPKPESLKLLNINRSYSNVVIPTSLRVIETRAAA